MQNLFVDFETFYDVGYSLRQQSMSITDYIRDGRFEALGASIGWEGERPRFIPGPDLQAHFDSLTWSDIRLVAHHTLFDGFILADVYGHTPAQYFCTMAMLEALFQGGTASGLDIAQRLVGLSGKTKGLIKGKRLADYTPEEYAKLVEYADGDIIASMALFKEFAHALPDHEWELMSATIRMFCEPRLEFDEATLREALQEAVDERTKNIADALNMFNCTEEDLKGNISFAEIIQRCGVEMPMKPSPTNPDKMIPALAKTDDGFKALQEHDDERVRAAVEGRLAVKSTQGITRAQRFISLHEHDGKFPVAYNYARAHTMRVTGGNKINATNLKRGSALRRSIVAPPGYVLGVADSGQIECRGVEYLAGQDDALEEFRQGLDPYNGMASDIFGEPIDRKNNPEHDIKGFVGKTARLGLGFQMGAPTFKSQLRSGRMGKSVDITLDLAYHSVNTYRRNRPKVVGLWNYIQNTVLPKMVANAKPFDFEYYDGVLHIDTLNNKVIFPNGTWLYYPMLSHDGSEFSYVNQGRAGNYYNIKTYGGKMTENWDQKFCRDIVMWQLMNIDQRYRVVMQTYDEVVALIPEKEAEEGMAWMLEEMIRTPDWAKSIPLAAEGGFAREYSK